jgi:hypothetical protein
MKPRITLDEDARRRLDFVRGEHPEKETHKGAPADTIEPEPNLLNQSFRLPSKLLTEVRRIVYDRKLAGIRPNSVNAIVIEALELWLEREKKRLAQK